MVTSSSIMMQFIHYIHNFPTLLILLFLFNMKDAVNPGHSLPSIGFLRSTLSSVVEQSL